MPLKILRSLVGLGIGKHEGTFPGWDSMKHLLNGIFESSRMWVWRHGWNYVVGWLSHKCFVLKRMEVIASLGQGPLGVEKI